MTNLKACIAISSLLMIAGQTMAQHTLSDPMKWANREGEATTLEQWEERRLEISNLIQEYEIGAIPSVSRDQVSVCIAPMFDGKDLLTPWINF